MRFVVTAWFAVMGCLAAPERSRGQDVEFMDPSEVRPGMRGIGKTVFSGDEITTFEVELIGVLQNTRPQGDLILFRGLGETLAHAGIIRGMSGSPVYIDGKLLGAVSFAYPNSKDPIGAITPIGEMLDLLVSDLGTAKSEGATGDGPVPSRTPRKEPGSRTPGNSLNGHDENSGVGSTSGSSYSSLGDPRIFEGLWNRFRHLEERSWTDLAAPLLPDGEAVSGQLSPMSTPITLAGWDASLIPEMQRVLGPMGFVASATGGGSSGNYPAPQGFEPGSAVGVQLIGGDADMVAIGTVTYVDEDRLLAFGHPMVQSGDVAFPMSGAWIHAVLPNYQVSMKMGSSTAPVGGIWNDRRSGIAGVRGSIPSQLPVRVLLQTDRGDRETFRYDLVRHDVLTPFFLPWTVTNSYLTSGWVFGDAAIRTEVSVFYNGGLRVRRVEQIATGVPGTALGGDITLPAALLLTNPFENARIDSVLVQIDYEKRNPRATIRSVRSSQRKVYPGDVVRFDVEIEPYRGQTEWKSLELEIPGSWAGQSLRVQIGATVDFANWDMDRAPEKFVPYDLPQMVDMIERMPDESALILRVYSGETGVLLQGVELPRLPPSVASAALLEINPRSTIPIQGSLLEEVVHETPWVLRGGETIALEVAQ